MRHYDDEAIVNVGVGEDRSIAEMVGFEGEFTYDTSKPDGTPRKLMDVLRVGV